MSGSTTATLNANSLTLGTVTATTIASTVPGAVSAAGSYPLVVTVNGVASNTFTCTISAAQAGNSGIPTDKDGNAIPDPSKNPNVIPQHAGVMGGNGNFGAGGTENAWAVSPTGRCTNTTPAITRIWYHNLDFNLYKNSNAIEYFGMYANEALVYSFIAPAEGTVNNINYGESLAGNFVASFLSISTSPCDFDVSKLGAAGGYCYSTRTGQNVIYYQATNGNANIPYCKLVPGQRYYINWRAQNALVAPNEDACQANVGSSTFCGGVLQIR